MWDWHTDLCIPSSNAGDVQVLLWWRRRSRSSYGHDWKDDVPDISDRNDFPLRVTGRTLRGGPSRVAAPPHQEESAELAWASVSDAPRTPPWGGVPDMSLREEDPEKTQDKLDGLLAGLAWKSWRSCLGKGKSGHFSIDCCSLHPASN